jgi:hypothetical protein
MYVHAFVQPFYVIPRLIAIETRSPSMCIADTIIGLRRATLIHQDVRVTSVPARGLTACGSIVWTDPTAGILMSTVDFYAAPQEALS